MKLNLLVFVVLVADISAIPVHHRRLGSRDIPVQVVYDTPSVRNLENKQPTEKPFSVKNLEAKPQLSLEESKEVGKHAPLLDNNVKIATSTAYRQGDEQDIDNIYEKINEIIQNGASKINAEFEKIPDNSHKLEVLNKVNNTLEEFLESTKRLIDLGNVQTLKQDAGVTTASPVAPNLFQQIFNSFQTFAGTMFSGLNPPGAQSEGTTAVPGGIPNPIEVVQGYIAQMQSNLGNLFAARPPVSGQSDETVTPSPPGPIQFIQQQLSGIFPRPTTAPSNPADEQQSANTNPIVTFVQSAISSVQNALNPSTSSSTAQDEVTPSTAGNNPLQFIQNAGQSVFQAFQNNPLFPGGVTTAASVVLSNTPSIAPIPAANQVASLASQNPLSNNPIQHQIQQAVPSNPSGQHIPGINEQGSSNLGQISNAINSLQHTATGGTTSKPANPVRAQDEVPDVNTVQDGLQKPVEKVQDDVPVKEELSNEVTEKKDVQS